MASSKLTVGGYFGLIDLFYSKEGVG